MEFAYSLLKLKQSTLRKNISREEYLADLVVFAQSRQIKFPLNLKNNVNRQIKFPPNLNGIRHRQIKFPPKLKFENFFNFSQ